MGSDTPVKISEARIKISSSFPGPMKKISKTIVCDDEYEWNKCMSFSHQSSTRQTLPSQPRSTVESGIYEDYCENKHENDDSFSSFLSWSIGENISKSFDWALDLTASQTCQIPFKFSCHPINFPKTCSQNRTSGHRCYQAEEDYGDVELTSLLESEEENDQKDKDEKRLYIPFRLPLSCEYCGSCSIKKCHEFDPNCQRPKTFFPKAKPPFGRNP